VTLFEVFFGQKPH
jgi:pyruvate dehydrogenase complex dehydrogenase (E1) component